jgi:flagellar hook-associated protein 2
VASGSIQITDKNGGSATVDLTNMYTVQDVLDAINAEEGIEITASVNAAGTALVLTDTSEGTGSITVAEAGSTTAADLGILGSSSGTTLEGGAVGDGTKIALSTIGITTNSSGTLEIDKTKFDAALDDNFDAVISLFTTSGIGLGQKAEDVADLLTDPLDGTIKARQDAINARITSMQSQIDRMELILEKREASLVRQFSALEKAVSQYNSIGQFLTNQLASYSEGWGG